MSSLKKRIADAARELYLHEGTQGFSMRKVADRVGVSAPAIYRHYRNKNELLNEIVIEGLRILEEYLRPALDAPGPYERLKQLTDNYLAFALEQPQYFDFAFLLPNREIEPVASEIARPDWTTFRMAVEQVGECMAQGIFEADDPLETSIAVWAGVHGLVTLYRTGRFGPDPVLFRGIYGNCVDRVLRGLMRDEARSMIPGRDGAGSAGS
jgi:AcrR family transcriptional regulator